MASQERKVDYPSLLSASGGTLVALHFEIENIVISIAMTKLERVLMIPSTFLSHGSFIYLFMKDGCITIKLWSTMQVLNEY